MVVRVAVVGMIVAGILSMRLRLRARCSLLGLLGLLGLLALLSGLSLLSLLSLLLSLSCGIRS